LLRDWKTRLFTCVRSSSKCVVGEIEGFHNT
jgi:hypothetical protein